MFIRSSCKPALAVAAPLRLLHLLSAFAAAPVNKLPDLLHHLRRQIDEPVKDSVAVNR